MELREKVKQFKPKRQIRKKLIRIFLKFTQYFDFFSLSLKLHIVSR